MGPGTHIEERVMNNVQPLNQSDAAAMIHDIEYLLYKDQTLPDKTSIQNSRGLYKPVMKLGYAIKNLFGYDTGKDKSKYYKLRHIIETHPAHAWVNKYKLKWSDGTVVKNGYKHVDSNQGFIINDTESIDLNVY